MGWSRRHSTERAVEAHARGAALERIGYVGRLDDDGHPLDGHALDGHALGNRQQPFKVPARNDWDRNFLAITAAEDACYGGGSQIAGNPYTDSDTTRPWPLGYRWDRSN